MLSPFQSKFAQLESLKIHYLEAGEGPVLLLLHGWPTSSWLYRNMIPTLAKSHRVIAIDLPGFGQSDKVLGDSFSLNYYLRVLDEFLQKLEIESLSLCVHDLGGPIGLLWAVRNRDRLEKLVLLNTLVYPQMSWAVKAFGLATVIPLLNMWLAGPSGIRASMRLGVQQKGKLTREVLAPYQKPFEQREARKVLLKSVQRMSKKGFYEIAENLDKLEIPVQIIYGENDRILPNVAETMSRVKSDIPQATITALPNCGHFLQEDEPEKIAALMQSFMT